METKIWKSWLISDTHRKHPLLDIPKDIDTVFHAGDSTNKYDWFENQPEFEDFIDWFSNLPIKNKILIAGNHDAWATKKYNRDKVKELGIHYLEHEYFELDGKLIFGSPYTPTFNNWHFMKDRSKLFEYWKGLDENIDILITHGPPKGILDLAYNKKHELEYCGDSALTKAVFKIKPKIHMFGHVHDNEDCYNYGMRTLDIGTKFYNCAVVKDKAFDEGVKHHGHIIEI